MGLIDAFCLQQFQHEAIFKITTEYRVNLVQYFIFNFTSIVQCRAGNLSPLTNKIDPQSNDYEADTLTTAPRTLV